MWFTELKHSGLLLVFLNPPAAMNLTATLSNEYQKHSTSSRLSHPPSFQNSKIPKKKKSLKRSSCCSNNNGTTNLDLSPIYCSDHHDKYPKKSSYKKKEKKEKRKPLSLR
jgi:hypothetical protein